MNIGRIGYAGLLAALVGTMAAAPALAGNRVEREEKRVVDAAGKSSISIKNSSGRTVVVGKSDAASVTVVAVKTVTGREGDEANARLDRLEVQIGEHGDQITVETHEDNKPVKIKSVWRLIKDSHRSAWVDYTIEVPIAFSVTATAASGEVRVSNIGGGADVSAASGDVSVRAVGGDTSARITSGNLEAIEIGGNLTVETASGDVIVDNVRGTLKVDGTSGDCRVARIGRNAELRLSSGEMTLEGCSGDVSARTASGDIHIDEVQGSVDASSSSGDIDVLIIPTRDRSFALSSSSGDIDLYYVAVKDFGFDLDVRTSSGSIQGDLPIRVSRVDRRQLQGVVGSGAARVEIATASGDVTIVERNQSATKSNR
jgi:hypothetical protein